MTTRQAPSTNAGHPLLTTPQGRQRLLTMAVNLTRDTPLAPSPQEQRLLTLFVQGTLTLDQVLEQLPQ